jgi:hypothetical protein
MHCQQAVGWGCAVGCWHRQRVRLHTHMYTNKSIQNATVQVLGSTSIIITHTLYQWSTYQQPAGTSRLTPPPATGAGPCCSPPSAWNL